MQNVKTISSLYAQGMTVEQIAKKQDIHPTKVIEVLKLYEDTPVSRSSRRKHRWLTAEEKKEIYESYKHSKLNRKELASKYNCALSTIDRIIHPTPTTKTEHVEQVSLDNLMRKYYSLKTELEEVKQKIIHKL